MADSDPITKTIALSKGLVALVDAADFEWLSQWKWTAHIGRGNHPEAVRMTPMVNGARRQMLYMHREILRPGHGLVVDHINGDSLDNRRTNMRIATLEENARNRRMGRVQKSSGYRGVRFLASQRGSKQWQVMVGRTFVGYFRTAEEGALARDDAARRLYGEFAVLNLTERT